MTIRLKIASSAEELDDAFELRHHVYEELGYFGDAGGAKYLSDRFDAHPYSYTIVAYDEAEQIPIGTLRLNRDTEVGLPAEEYYDFTPHRQSIAEEWMSLHGEEPIFSSAGMLAIRKGWRNRRDVIRSLFKMSATVGNTAGVTHVIATVNYESHMMYKRIGFVFLDEKQWIEEIGEFIVPMMITFEAYYQWAMGDLLQEKALLDLFPSQYQRVVLKKGEYLFKEGDEASECYVVDTGSIKITRMDAMVGRELTLTVLKRGGLVGELALIDNQPRSANAIALTNTDLMVLERDEIFGDLSNTSERMQELLRIFSQRIRSMDGLAVVLAYGSARQRLEFALKGFWNTATADKKRPDMLVARVGPADLAHSAGVTEADAVEYLDELQSKGACEYSDTRIRFFDRRICTSGNGKLQLKAK
jgi:CRP-like cAMP-binding protein